MKALHLRAGMRSAMSCSEMEKRARSRAVIGRERREVVPSAWSLRRVSTMSRKEKIDQADCLGWATASASHTSP